MIPSATQEEVLFSCAPECFPTIFLTETLESDEIILIHGVYRYSLYSGYADTFQFNGYAPLPDTLNTTTTSSNEPFSFSVLVMDAAYSNHFQLPKIQTDINKALLAFWAFAHSHSHSHSALNPLQRVSISTGGWGCGAFGGDRTAKLLQQILALLVANGALTAADTVETLSILMHYSSYFDDKWITSSHRLLSELCLHRVTFKQILDWMTQYRTIPRQSMEFYQFLEKQIRPNISYCSVQ